MAINRTLANAYFAPTNHPRASVWAEFTNDQKDGAIAHAKRTLSRLVVGPLIDTTTTDNDFPRHDIAVYEQALWSLENSPLIRDGREESADAIADDPEAPDNVRQASTATISPEARRWITSGGITRIGRG